ncbi:hypothetical protein [Lysobacter sp. HA18]
MIRKLILPLAATALLAGCVAMPYDYRSDGHGDYYYGSPSVEYRYEGGWPYSGFGYPGYYGPYRSGFSIWGGYYGGGYPGYYGSPYYGSPYYGYPRYGYPYHNSHPNYPRPNYPNNNNGHRPDGGPWRNPDEIVRRRRQVDGGGGGVMPIAPRPEMPSVSRPDVGGGVPRMGGRRDGDGTATGDVIRRARRGSENEP